MERWQSGPQDQSTLHQQQTRDRSTDEAWNPKSKEKPSYNEGAHKPRTYRRFISNQPGEILSKSTEEQDLKGVPSY